MINKWFKANREKRSSIRNSNRSHRPFGEFEQLEDKRCLAFLGFFDGITLDIVQTADDGDVLVENSTGVWRATDNEDTFTFVNATNVTVEMIDNTANRLDFAVDLVHTGDVGLDVGNGVREVFFVGLLNEIGGNLNITSGDGTQEIRLQEDVGVELIVHGDMNIDMGFDQDVLQSNGTLVTVDGNITVTGANDINMPVFAGIPAPITPGDYTIDNSFEDEESILQPAGGTIYGDFTYLGGVNIDTVNFGGMFVEGGATLDLGLGNPFFGVAQSVTMDGTVNTGDIIITADDSNLGNEIFLTGGFNGNIVSYTGGDLVDLIDYQLLWPGIVPQADALIDMGGGDDTFELNLPANLLEIDFGNDVGDEFVNNVGVIDFEYDITNFHNFDFFYTALDDRLVMNQLTDTGDVVIDNDGGVTGFDWQVFPAPGGVASLGPAQNLVLNMISNTGNNVEMDLVNPTASIEMNLGDGDRVVEFTGLSNNLLRDIFINAGAGEQRVDLSVNDPLGVASLNVNLGTGFDVVEDNANDLIIDEDLVFTGVNEFIHDGLLTVFRDAIIDTTGETEDSVFISNGSFFVGAEFAYTGGDGSDDLRLNGAGGTEITKTTFIDLGDSVGGLPQFALLDGPNMTFSQSLTVLSSNSTGTDLLATGIGGSYFGDVMVDLGGGPNNAILLGTFNATNVSYAGGSGPDDVTYGMTGNPANLNVMLDGGNDVFTLLAGSTIASPLNIDFGGGDDTFINNYGVFDFDANLLNLNGFDHFYTLATDTLHSIQISDTGDVAIDNDGPSESIRFKGTTVLMPVTNLTVDLLNGTTTDLDIVLEHPLDGDLTIDLANGNRRLDMTGVDNTVMGNFDVTGGTGNQTINLALNAPLSVGGFARFDLGTGNDAVDENGNNVNIDGHLQLIGVNSFENDAVVIVGGNFSSDVSFELISTIVSDASPLIISGDFTYLGSDAADSILFNNLTTIGGNILIDAANGFNQADLLNVNGGALVTYTGGSGIDLVNFGGSGSAPMLNISTGSNDDVFNLNPGSVFSAPLMVDMGAGADIFLNGFGNFTFDAFIWGANGFDHSYDFSEDKLTSTQVEALGNTIVDNNGPANAIRFTNVGTSVLMPVSILEVNMSDLTPFGLDVDLDAALAGDLMVDLGDGDRLLELTGSNNTIVGDLYIMGGSGEQFVDINVNTQLTVGGQADIDLGSGFDSLDDDGNDLVVTGDLMLHGVNNIVVDSVWTIGGSLIIDNSGELEGSVFNDDGAVFVDSNFIYTGNDANDVVSLDSLFGGFNVGGNINLFMGDGDNTAVLESGFFGGLEIDYVGGSGTDIVCLGLPGNNADVNIVLDGGNDIFELKPTAMVQSLVVDFGTGIDTFDNNYGLLDFPTTLLSLDGFNHTYLPLTETLISQQVGSVGGLVTFANDGPLGAMQVFNGSATLLGLVSTLDVTMQDFSGDNLNVELDSILVDNLTVDLGDGIRTLALTGINNTVGGNVTIFGGSFAQSVELAVIDELNVGGGVAIDLGTGSDSISVNGNGLETAGHLMLHNVNNFVNDDLVQIGGDLHIDVSGESEDTQIVDSAIIDVAGDLLYEGGDAADILLLNANTQIGGDININAGNGANEAAILGVLGGNSVKYTGGSGTDAVNFGTTGSPADVNVKLKANDDVFVLEAGAAILPSSLRVDFGGGDDTFTSNYGQFDFNAQLLNLDGYDAFFDLSTGNMDIIQVSDSGDVIVDNNGPSSAIRFGTGAFNTISPANDLRLILLDNTSTNVVTDFDNVRNGNTVIQLRSGNRDVSFTGSSNFYSGLLRVEASDGVQTLNVSVTNSLTVDGTFIFNGRDGSDTLMATNLVSVSGAMLLRGVNTFVNDAGVIVSGDLNMITLLEDEDTSLISNNTFVVGGNLTYLGGGGVDAINFKTNGATIGGFTYIDIAESTDAVENQRINLTGGFSTDNLVVDGSTAIAGNVFTTDAATNVTNDVIVNFASASPTNIAVFFGTYGGTYGTYRGGTGSDFVTFGATATDMLFASLMGSGDDEFTIAPTADLDFLYVDFGPGNDTLDNQLGDPLPFGNNIFNL